MDEMQSFDYKGWEFLCSGERLPSGHFQAAVRYRTPPDHGIRTLILDEAKYDSPREALRRALALAKAWADDVPG